MAHKNTPHGTYMIDRRFRGVGRIKRASGATTKGGLRARNACLTGLYDKGRLDALRAIRDGTLSVTVVYDAWREERVDTLLEDQTPLTAPLWPIVNAWLPKDQPTGGSRGRYRTSFTALERSGVLKDTATVADLKTVNWEQLYVSWPNGAYDWNHLRRAVGKFLSVQLGLHHPLRVTLLHGDSRRNVPPLIAKAKELERIPDLSVTLLWRIVDAAPEHIRPAIVTLVITGLRCGEYLRLTKANLKPHTHAIAVPGTKTEASAATLYVAPELWSWVERAVPPPVRYRWLRLHFKRACAAAGAPDLRLHDLRHAHAQWLTNAGRSEASVQVSLRHSSALMTRRYSKQRDRGENAKVMANILLRSA